MTEETQVREESYPEIVLKLDASVYHGKISVPDALLVAYSAGRRGRIWEMGKALASAAEREKELREVVDRGYLLAILLRTFADTRDPLDKDAACQMGEFMREAERVLGK